MNESDDEYYMRAALAYARHGLGQVAPNPSVGCVIVKNGRIIGRGRTAPGGRPHAEAAALAMAGFEAKKATAYITLEPCAVEGRAAPCASALVKAGIKRAVIGCIDPNPLVFGQGVEVLQKAGIEVVLGVLEKEARASHQGFFLCIEKGRPLITLKLAVSKDGKIAAAPGQRTAVSGALAQRYTHLQRSLHDGILVGIGTVLADDPLLTARLPGYRHRISRVVLDSDLRIPESSQLVQSAGDDPLIVMHRSEDAPRIKNLKSKGLELIQCDTNDLLSVVSILSAGGMTRLLVEGGAQIASSFLKAGLVDECHLIRSPDIIGTNGLAALAESDIDRIGDDFGLKLQETRALAQDLLEIYAPSD